MAISTAAAVTPPIPLDPLAMWGSAPLLAAGLDPSFDVDAAAESPLTWTFEAPADADAAAAQLVRMEAALQAHQLALDAAGSRLDALIAGAQADGSVSFDGVAAQVAWGSPENDLLDLLAEAEKRDVTAVDFGIAGLSIPHWDEIAENFQGFLDRLRRFLAHYAWVETKIEGRMVARTEVSWLGDFQTSWTSSTASDMDLHQRALGLALATRKTTLRILLFTVAGAVKITPLLASPGSAVLALPAVWRFINQIRSELEEQIPQPT